MSLSKKIADQWLRKQAAPALLRTVLQELEILRELSENLSEVEDEVAQTFKMGKVIDPEVKSQFDALRKATEGLKSAKAVAGAIVGILTHYPGDKTAVRAGKDAAVMVKRFEKHEADARKIIQRLSKKALPPALKKMSDSLGRMLKARLVNPKDLTVTWWQSTDRHYSTSGTREGVKYVVLFRVGPKKEGVGLQESTVRSGVFPVHINEHGYSDNLSGTPKPTTAKQQVAQFMENLRGNPLLKGEEDRTQTRVDAAKELYDEIKYRWDRIYRGDYSSSEMDPKGRSMEFGNRSIPHDSYASHREVEEGLEAESDWISKWLNPILQRHKALVKNHSFEASEKGYMTLYIQLN